MSRIAPETWNRLESARPAGDAFTVRLAAADTTARLQAAIDAEGRRHFLILLRGDEAALHDAESRGLTVATRELRLVGGAPDRFLDIVCQDATGNAAFDLIGGELADALAAGVYPPAIIAARVLAKWRRFWGQLPRSLLSREAQLGLFAEAWFLGHWLIPVAGVAAVARWRGPFSSRHDFEWQGRSVEVKASTIVRAPVFRIHGLDQLDPPANGELFLFALRVREEAGAPHSLPSVISECETLLRCDGEALARYETALARSGYSPAHESEYSQTYWRIVDERLYPVISGFPRLSPVLLPGGVPPGVSEICYALDLGGYVGPAFTTAATCPSLS